MPASILFTSLFTTDTLYPGVYSRGSVPVSRLSSGKDPIVIRVEDVILDIAHQYMHSRACSGLNGMQRYNLLYRVQCKPCFELDMDKVSMENVPVFYPMYRFLSGLKTLGFDVTLLHDSPALIRSHPLFQVLDFRGITSDKLDTVPGSAHILSPYTKDSPDYMFPRSFNSEADMDTCYTVRID
ncbi:MAG: hypothetical protein WC279_13230 [Sulfurimonas sp.]|jgi:hypothetical protein|uniref:hypothetical protein n=1 Tax=Sulfurimonas sp. TaxID=2022749 RepID=UPI0035655541